MSAPSNAPACAVAPDHESTTARLSQTIILLFDRDDHPAVPTCAFPGRRAQWRSRMTEGHRALRAARSVLDGREHDGTLDTEGANPIPPVNVIVKQRRAIYARIYAANNNNARKRGKALPGAFIGALVA